MLKVIHFQRRPAPGQVSIERVFAEVRSAMPSHVECTVHQSPCYSHGVLPRIANLADAAKSAGPIHHIVGDVHYLAMAVPGSLTLLTIHDCVSLERLRGFKRALFRWVWYVLPVWHARLVSVVSEFTKRELLQYVPCHPSKIRVIHNCIGSEFVPSPRPFYESNPVILQVGTGPNKNLARVVAALSDLRCVLRIVGPLTPAQRTLLEGHRIHFENLPSACPMQIVREYQQADVVIFASTYEGFGLPILEAQAVGRPVVTSQKFSMPEVAGRAACLVDPYDVASLRAGLLRVLTEPEYRRWLVAAGFENVKRFAPAVIASRYAALYEEISQACCRNPGLNLLRWLNSATGLAGLNHPRHRKQQATCRNPQFY